MSSENPYLPVQIPALSPANSKSQKDSVLYVTTTVLVLVFTANLFFVQYINNRLRFENGFIVVETTQTKSTGNPINSYSAVYIDVPGLVFLLTLVVAVLNLFIWLFLKAIRQRYRLRNAKLE